MDTSKTMHPVLSLVLYTAAVSGGMLKQQMHLDSPALQGSLVSAPENNTLYVCGGKHCVYEDCISLPNEKENWDEIKACRLSPRAPCSCKAGACSCCVQIKLEAMNINGNLCVELVYTKAEAAIAAILEWDDVPFFAVSFARPSKEPFCAALPIPNVNVCASVTDITFSGGSPHFCAGLTLNVYEKPVLVLTLGCFKVLLASDQDESGNLLVPADAQDQENVNSGPPVLSLEL